MTPAYPYLKGVFHFAGCSVPYFQLSLSIHDALSHLRIARELIFDPREIVLEELFQRDIDEVRVEREITPYLQRDGELKFFNSLVVVLLPHKDEKLQSQYSMDDADSATPQIVGVECESGEVAGTLRWDPQHIMPIIVDGQHRFAAIRNLSRTRALSSEPDFTLTSIPVVALVLHESYGFQAASPSLISTVRRMFIDLNRQARSVSEARNVLLDDRDVAAVAVRSLIEQHVDSGKNTLSDRLDSGHIPLALVDWYSDRIKFDRGVHLTSLLALYQIVTDFLNIPRCGPYDYEKADDLIRRFQRLGPELDFQSTIAACIDNKAPLYLTDADVKVFENWFRTTWGPSIVHVLLHLAPYRQFLDELRSLGFVDGPYETWAALDRAGKKVFEESHADAREIASRQQIASASKANDLAFQVVFQRGLLRAFLAMCQAEHSAEVSGMTQESVSGFARQWVDQFNTRLGAVTKNYDVWRGTVVRGDDSLNATRTAEKAICGIVVFSLLAPVDDWSSEEPHVQRSLARDYVDEFRDVRVSQKLEPMNQIKAIYVKPWRALVRKHVQEFEGVYGRRETDACSEFMVRTLLKGIQGDALDHLAQESLANDPLLQLIDEERSQ